MKRLGKTPPFRRPTGELVPGSIAEIHWLRLGGVEQWVMIRGESVANPLLILLHGGPGMSETAFFRHFNAPLERDFTVVYWDQRGAGKSFHRQIPRSSMTVEQLVADLDQLVDAVRQRVGKSKVVLYGHSWGSALGVLYAARYPEKVAAYVGSGQMGDALAGERASYAWVLAELQRRNEPKAVAKLLSIGPPPHPAKKLMVQRMALSRAEGRLRAGALWHLGRILLGATESSVLDLLDGLRGFYFCLDTMWAEVSALNLVRAVPALQMPLFFFLGRQDHWVPAEVSVAYFESLAAPSKQLVWFEESGHEPFMDEPAKLNAAMVALVRPVAAAEGAALPPAGTIASRAAEIRPA
jgi:pimeloyl-ACP methyl ester carboxylesterase